MDKEQNSNDAMETLATAMATWFVRSNNFFYTVERPEQRRSSYDVKSIALQRFKTQFPEISLTTEIASGAFKLALEGLSTDPRMTIPVWDGRVVAEPRNAERLLRNYGEVSINSWVLPSYRSLSTPQRDASLLFRLLEAMMPEREDREMFKDWLSWSLQNEADKPGWAIILYSQRKGTGKSTLCKLTSALFGGENSITQNNIEKVHHSSINLFC